MAAAISIRAGGLTRRTRALERRLEREVGFDERRQGRNDSALLHPNAGVALAIAARPLEEGARPVAIVLEDGTVQSLRAGESTAHGFSSGRVSGRGWTLWWERRSWAKA